MGLQPATLTGQLLIAMPSIDTPYFNRSVIYVCAHTAEGAMGIVLNSPLDSPSFDDLLAQLGVAPTPPNRRAPRDRATAGWTARPWERWD